MTNQPELVHYRVVRREQDAHPLPRKARSRRAPPHDQGSPRPGALLRCYGARDGTINEDLDSAEFSFCLTDVLPPLPLRAPLSIASWRNNSTLRSRPGRFKSFSIRRQVAPPVLPSHGSGDSPWFSGGAVRLT